jgi:hypothetical protein
MLPEDVFRRQFDETIATLERRSKGLRTVADVTVETAGDYWRLKLEPFIANACPIEFILHRDQTYDVMIGPEAYERRQGLSPSAYEALLDAVVAGRVTTRRRSSAATGLEIETETVVDLGHDEGIWRASRDADGRRPGHNRDGVVADRHYVPYAR